MAEKKEDKKKKDGEEKSGGGNKMMIIMIAVMVILLIAVGVAAFLFGARMGAKEQANNNVPVETEEQAPENMPGPLVEVQEFIINILDNDENTRYLKAAMTLEVDSEETVTEVTARMPQIRDTILLLMGNKTFDELRDLQGKLQLRAEMLRSINKVLSSGKVNNIFFTEFVVQ
jgi:flagellar FliL protein